MSVAEVLCDEVPDESFFAGAPEPPGRPIPLGTFTPGAQMPPHDLTAEASVLSTVIVRGREALAELGSTLSPEDMYSEAHRRILEAAIDVRDAGDAPIDTVTIATRLRDTGRLEQAGNMNYLIDVMSSAPHIDGNALQAYAATVRRHSTMRRVLASAQMTAARIYGGLAVEHAVAELGELSRAVTVAQQQLAEDGPRVSILDGAAIAKELPPLEYLCGPLGMTAGSGPPHMIAGYGFSGKTVAIQSMAVSLAAGRSIWGCYTATPRRVLHVDLEQGERLSRRRYQRLALAMNIDLAELGDSLALSVMPGLTFCAGDMSAWERLMTGRDFMVVDSLRVAQPGAEENSSAFREGLDMLGELSKRTGCRPSVIHHARKAGDDKPQGGAQSIRGSSAILDACDAVYVFSASKGEPVSVESVKTREHGEPPPEFALVISDVTGDDGDPKAGLSVAVLGYEAVLQKREEKAAARRKSVTASDVDRVREQIRVRPGVSTRDLKESTGLNGVRFSAATLALKDELETKDELRAGHWVTRHYLRGST
jgi:hypothetical protein